MRDDLQELLFAYMEAAGITHAPKKAHVLCKTGTKQEIQVVKCELLPRFQGTCMQKNTAKTSSRNRAYQGLITPGSGPVIA